MRRIFVWLLWDVENKKLQVKGLNGHNGEFHCNGNNKPPSIDHNDDLIWVQNIIYSFQGIYYGDWVLQERVLALKLMYIS